MDYDDYLLWLAEKHRQGYPIPADHFMECLNRGLLTPVLSERVMPTNVGFSIAEKEMATNG